jgi:hypothetical protein
MLYSLLSFFAAFAVTDLSATTILAATARLAATRPAVTETNCCLPGTPPYELLLHRSTAGGYQKRTKPMPVTGTSEAT